MLNRWSPSASCGSCCVLSDHPHSWLANIAFPGIEAHTSTSDCQNIGEAHHEDVHRTEGCGDGQEEVARQRRFGVVCARRCSTAATTRDREGGRSWARPFRSPTM